MFVFNKNMEANIEDDRVRFTESLNDLASNGTIAGLSIAIVGIIGLLIYMIITIDTYYRSHKTCKGKPSATDATITCPNQNSSDPTSVENPYYLSAEGKPIPITTFYGAVSSL